MSPQPCCVAYRDLDGRSGCRASEKPAWRRGAIGNEGGRTGAGTLHARSAAGRCLAAPRPVAARPQHGDRQRLGGRRSGGQINFHMNRAMDSGLTEQEAGEMLTQLAFYAGWPNVFSAMAVFKKVVAQRAPAVSARQAVVQRSDPACLMVSMMRPSARDECLRLG